MSCFTARNMTFVAWNPELFLGTNMNGLVLRCLGPGFTVLALGPGFRPIIIICSYLLNLVGQVWLQRWAECQGVGRGGRLTVSGGQQ